MCRDGARRGRGGGRGGDELARPQHGPQAPAEAQLPGVPRGPAGASEPALTCIYMLIYRLTGHLWPLYATKMRDSISESYEILTENHRF